VAARSKRHWPSRGEAGKVRIIGGQWRGRKLHFIGAEGLRPTGDRMRETLFNWLQPSIEGSRCLDLFAGSGALGFEAASRGAAEVVMVEYNPATAGQLQRQAEQFGAENLSIHQGSALHYLNALTAPVDVIFLDPPFHSELLQLSLNAIDPGRMLRPKGRIYLEYPLRREPALPEGMQFVRQKKAGDVGYGLIGVDQEW
jgi:16S rRNA (guanine966-N2)-methyltransferase